MSNCLEECWYNLGASTELPTCTADDRDVEKCKMFVERICGCSLANGSPCSSLFSVDDYVSHRSQASLLTHNELDLVLIGSMMSLVNTQADKKTGKQAYKKIAYIYHIST